MSNQVAIEVQDQFGAWHHFQTVSNTAASIKLGLKSALKSPLGKKSKRARAVDIKTKQLIDIAQE